MSKFRNNDVKELAETILSVIEKEPLRFYDILRKFEKEEYRKILLAWSEIMEQKKIIQDQFGKWHPISEKENITQV